jgi:Ca-activated chloride channel homolog
VNQVDEIAAEVAQDIRTQYTISYHSTKSPLLGGYREVHVEAKGKSFGRLSVRTRTGYYPKVAASDSTGGAPALNNAGSKQANKKRD